MPSCAYTDHALDVLEERGIHPSLVERTLRDPERTLPDPVWPERCHALRRIPEHGGRVLRVVYTRSTDPLVVVTVFFDRRMKGKL